MGWKSGEETSMVGMMIWVSCVVRESEKNGLVTLFMGGMDDEGVVFEMG